MAQESLSIAEVSRRFELSEDTLRYYEKIGLMTSHRRPSGIRYYASEDIGRLEFIKCMRDAGVSLEALLRYMKLFSEGDKTIQERKELLMEQRGELFHKKELIEHSLERLNYKIDNYDKLMAKGCPKNK
jgi:MerR family transcriptional regulator, aldehyde-responsive regulator